MMLRENVINGMISSYVQGETGPLENYIPIAYLITGV
jgi:hypothetical protein